MNSRFRSILFWLHLAAGVVVGLVVAVMSLTGAALAFEAQLRDWAERDSRTVIAPAGAPRLPVDDLVKRAQAARPGVPVTAILVSADPGAAVRISLGREDGVHVDPYRGEVRALSGQRTREVMGLLIRWHRYLGAAGEGRELGQAITGVSNASFLFLAFSGLILWWPRRWSARAVRAVLWFRRGLGGRARDFNWHNVIGFWSLPALIVITASGLMISYRPVSNFIFTLAGEKPPAPGPGGPGAAGAMVPAPGPGAKRVPLETLFAAARAKVPTWTTALVRLGGPGGARGRAGGGPGGGGPGGVPALTLSVKGPDVGPPFASLALAFDPFTGKLLKEDRFADQSTGRKVRTWMRFLHTGEALGVPGQLVAGLVSFGAAVLVYTGFAMALRRLRAWYRARAAASAPLGVAQEVVESSR